MLKLSPGLVQSKDLGENKDLIKGKDLVEVKDLSEVKVDLQTYETIRWYCYNRSR